MKKIAPVPPASAGRGAAFTLIEMLVVIAVIAVLAGLMLPSFSLVTRSQALQHAGDLVANSLIVARENALAENRQVSVRFIEGPASNGQTEVLAVQSWIISDANVATPLTKPMWLPNGVVISPPADLSPLLAVNTGTLTVGGESRTYVGFNFFATGAPSLPAVLPGSPSSAPANTYITVVGQKDANAATAPANFRSIWVNPVTGEIRTFAP